ncbi:MAG: cupin domain-containing protein [Desulfosudaceae bacterium]
MRSATRQNTARDYIRAFDLQPHPEGGYFAETYRSAEKIDGPALPERFTGRRALSTAILFLLESGQVSRFHRIRADEIWHFHAGCPLALYLLKDSGTCRRICLGLDIAAGHLPQVLVPHDTWFGAMPLEADTFSLVGCTTAPGFEFSDFELADSAALAADFPRHREIIRRLS